MSDTKIIMTIIVAALVILLAGCGLEAETPSGPDNIPAVEEKQPAEEEILTLMFPDKQFTRENQGFRDNEGKLYVIKDVVEGSFILAGRTEKLAIIEVIDGLSHAEGFYQAYLAVLDESGEDILSSIKNFSADEGRIALFDSKEKTYVFFAGSSTFNGWTGWAGGLWEADEEWIQKWPQDNDFWEHRAVEIENDGLKVFRRKMHLQENQLIPDYEWEYEHKLMWDSDSAGFIEEKTNKLSENSR